jgi:hypothetical protein
MHSFLSESIVGELVLLDYLRYRFLQLALNLRENIFFDLLTDTFNVLQHHGHYMFFELGLN